MRYSVIIPVYNRREAISEAIESVLRQDTSCYEVVVIDDGSTDGTREVIEEYESVRYIRQDNRGPAVARNRGASVARGDYLTFLDSDDLWLPWTLSTYDTAVSKHNHPSFIVGTQVEGDAHTGTQVTRTSFESRSWQNYYTASLAREGLIEPPSARVTAVDKDAFREVGGFASEDRNFEDADLWMRLGTVQDFVHIASPPVAVYRKHEDGISNDMVRVYEGVESLIENEKGRSYPGEKKYADARSKIITLYTRSKSIELAKSGFCGRAKHVYMESLEMNAGINRWKYILFFPILLMTEYVKRINRGRNEEN